MPRRPSRLSSSEVPRRRHRRRRRRGLRDRSFPPSRRCRPEIAGALRRRDRRVHRLDRVRIFRADVDVALGGADRDARDRHALDHHEGIAFHDHAVGKRAAVAFVGVADDEFPVGAGLRHRLPLDAGREAGAAAAAQSGGRDVGEDRVRAQRQRPLKALVAVMGAVILDRARIDHAAAREGQASLPLQPGDFVSDTQPQRMRAVGDHRFEYRCCVGPVDRTVGDAALRRGDLDHWLQPVQPA